MDLLGNLVDALRDAGLQANPGHRRRYQQALQRHAHGGVMPDPDLNSDSDSDDTPRVKIPPPIFEGLPRERPDAHIVRYHVPKFPHSSATFNIILGSRILASPKVLQGSLGNSACPTQCSQPHPVPANRNLTGLTWFPIVLNYIK